MIIRHLRLIAFGPFTDKSLDFSTGNFQLVYGQNEAGKSSMLRAVEAVLFGIPIRSKDTFIHRGPDLRTLRDRDGASGLHNPGLDRTDDRSRRVLLARSCVRRPEPELSRLRHKPMREGVPRPTPAAPEPKP